MCYVYFSALASQRRMVARSFPPDVLFILLVKIRILNSRWRFYFSIAIYVSPINGCF